MATLTNTLTGTAPSVGAEEIESLMAALLEQRTDRNNNNTNNIYDLAATAGSKQLLQRLASCPSDGSGRRVNGGCPVPLVGNSNGIDAHQVRSALALIAAAVSTPTAVVSTTPLADSIESLARQRRPLDRSASEPIPPTASSLAAAAIILDQQGAAGNGLVGMNSAAFCRYKTELCRPFEENGTCKYGDKCQFAHGRAELRPIVRHPKYKTDLCRTYHTTGLCPYGPRCHFIHNDEERRLNEVNRAIIEQQRATLIQVQQQQQQQELLASTLLTQQRLQQALRQHQHHQVEHAIASSLQRSLSLGSGSARPAKADLFRSPAAAPMTLIGNVTGSIDSGMSSAESPSSPTSLATSPTMSSGSSSGSEVEVTSSPFQTKQPVVIGDAGQHRKHQRQIVSGSASSVSSSPEVPLQGVPEIVSSEIPPVNRLHQKQMSNETAISATLLTRRLRDATSYPAGSDVEATLSQLLAAAAARNGCIPSASTSGSLDVAPASIANSVSGGSVRCNTDMMVNAPAVFSVLPRWQGTRYGNNTTQL